MAGRNARVTARREEMLDACDRVVRRSGAQATMTDMAAEAGITKLVLYRHFGDKGGVHRALAERWTAPVLASVDAVLSSAPPGRELIERTLDAYLAFVEAEPGPYRFLIDPASGERAGGLRRGLGPGRENRATRSRRSSPPGRAQRGSAAGPGAPPSSERCRWRGIAGSRTRTADHVRRWSRISRRSCGPGSSGSSPAAQEPERTAPAERGARLGSVRAARCAGGGLLAAVDQGPAPSSSARALRRRAGTGPPRRRTLGARHRAAAAPGRR